MDHQSARNAVTLIALLIGEIMEDHAGAAIAPPATPPAAWSGRLTQAGEDIETLGRALSVFGRRYGLSEPDV